MIEVISRLRRAEHESTRIIKRIEADGWFWVRTKGDHRQFHHAIKPGTVTVAGKLSEEIPPGTLNSILRQAGLKGGSQ
jgi:predicted RNA binding protein YcfA (HicA-like mRNA interferase family)